MCVCIGVCVMERECECECVCRYDFMNLSSRFIFVFYTLGCLVEIRILFTVCKTGRHALPFCPWGPQHAFWCIHRFPVYNKKGLWICCLTPRGACNSSCPNWRPHSSGMLCVCDLHPNRTLSNHRISSQYNHRDQVIIVIFHLDIQKNSMSYWAGATWTGVVIIGPMTADDSKETTLAKKLKP